MPCTSIALRNIAADDCLSSIGGIRKIYFALYDENMFTVGTSGEDENIVTAVKEDSEWFSYSFRRGTASFNSTVQVGDNGANFVTTTISMSFSRMDSKKRAAVSALSKADTVALVEDMNGQVWALGHYDSITDAGSSAETGAAKTDANQFVINLTVDSDDFPLAVKESVIEGLTFGN